MNNNAIFNFFSIFAATLAPYSTYNLANLVAPTVVGC
jgi:hypothetical protein